MNHQAHTAKIIKYLERNLSSGCRSYEIFLDWLRLVNAVWDSIPAHLASLSRTGQFCPTDTPETATLFTRLRERYPHSDHWQNFSAAVSHLLFGAVPLGYADVIGQVYMQFGCPSKYHGQIFTSWDVAEMMACLTLGPDPDALITDRLDRAAEQAAKTAPEIAALHLLDDGDPVDWPRRLPAVFPYLAPHFTPIRVLDPCVGSGVLLLAAASRFNPFFVHAGLVHFFGIDIDPVSVELARTNLKLYGLNSHAKPALELSRAEIDACPSPYNILYGDALTAHRHGDTPRVQAITETFNHHRAVGSQLSAFSD